MDRGRRTLTRGKESARSAACKSNLRQMGLALFSYAHDAEYFPAAKHRDVTISPFVTYGWPARLLPYLSSNTTVFRCPSRDSRFEWPTNISPKGFRFPFNIDPGVSHFSYGYNVFGVSSAGGFGLAGAPSAEVPVSRVVNPSEMIALSDSDGDGFLDGEITFNRTAMPGGPKVLFPPGSCHKGGANAVFCDGHVEWAPQAKWIEKTDDAARRWNNDNQPHRQFWVSTSGF